MRSYSRFAAWGGILTLVVAGIGCGSGATDPTALASPGAEPQATFPDEWPMYGQNPSRTSRNPGETRITAASVARLAPRWQAFIGQGPRPPSGTPAVAGGRVFVGSSVREGDNFLAFEATTGRPLWTADVGHWPTDEGVGIGAGPAVAGGTVVAGGGDAAYYGLDAATGALLWRHALDAGPGGFAWASPFVASGRAYVGVASEGGNPAVAGELRALDLATGDLLASRRFVPDGERGASLWNSPASSPDGRTLVVTTGNDVGDYDGPWTRAVISLDPATLDVRQSDQRAAPRLDLDFGTSPVVFRDARGRTLVGANQKNGTFHAYDLDALAAGPIWSRPVGISVGMMPAYDPDRGPGGTLYVAGDNGQLFAVDPATGADRWPPVAVGFMNANMALVNGLILVSTGGSVLVLEQATGRLLRALEPENPGQSFSGVAVAGGIGVLALRAVPQRMGTAVRRVLGVFLLAALSGCGAGGSSPAAPAATPTPAAGMISLIVDPNPVPAVETGDPDTPLRAEWTVTIVLRGGAAGTVNFVNATLRDAETGVIPEPRGTINQDGAEIAEQAGTNRIAPGGRIRVAQGLDYLLPADNRRGTLVVTAQLTDDQGNLVSQSVSTTVE